MIHSQQQSISVFGSLTHEIESHALIHSSSLSNQGSWFIHVHFLVMSDDSLRGITHISTPDSLTSPHMSDFLIRSQQLFTSHSLTHSCFENKFGSLAHSCIILNLTL